MPDNANTAVSRPVQEAERNRVHDALFSEAAQVMAELREQRAWLRTVLVQCEDYFAPRADAEIFHDGAMGNEEMGLLCEVREALRRTA